MEERIVVTGIGVLTAVGIGKEKFWEGLMEGRPGVRRISRFDTSDYPTKIAAEIRDFEPAEYMEEEFARKATRWNQLGIAATRLALEDAGLDADSLPRERTGVSVGIGGEIIGLVDERSCVEKGVYLLDREPPAIPNVLPNLLSAQLGLLGPNICIATACSAGNNAVGQARDLIRLGMADVMITGGTESPVLPLVVASFCALRIMSKRNDDPGRASRPFDRDRDGFVLGEGAGIMILEREGRARERGARIYAEVAGYGATCDAHHMTIPAPDKVQISRAMRLALEDAGEPPEAIDYINAHGTSTEANDIGETRAIKSVFGERAREIPVSSIKSMIGHTIGAAGAIELIATILAVERGRIPPTINQETPDPRCDLDYVPNEARTHDVRAALSNSFGFGGNNTSILVRRMAEQP
jgi:3-oxoacyl-[acyl-carrier-protein] synthase II